MGGLSGAPERPLIEYLLDRAESTEVAFTYLDCTGGRDAEPRDLTWAELVRQVRAVATRLRQVAAPGDRVALVTPQDLTYVVGFLGALYAGVVAVPLFAPEVRSHRQRLIGALNDCEARVWLTSRSAVDKLTDFTTSAPVTPPAHLLCVDDLLLPAEDADLLLPAEAGQRVAYLQYTSGSTREPAGAVITHRALTASAWQVAGAYQVDHRTTCAGWIPFFHDMGLIQLMCVPVFTGARAVFMQPLEFIRRPVRWLRQLSDYPAVFTAAPNFAFDYAVTAVPASARKSLDLGDVRVALNGSEPVRPATVRAFAEAFAPCGFRPEAHRPSYGLAEATVYVSSAGDEGPTITTFDRDALATGSAVVAETGTELVSVGRPFGQEVRIVDNESGEVCPDGQVGEIQVRGPHLALGYWRQPERSAETFTDGWLRTGDLGVVHDGQLYITGRIKDLIIVDGRNLYPQDIEETAADAHPGIRRDRVAAFGIADDRGEGVVVLAEPVRDQAVDFAEVSKAVRAAVSAQHEVALRDFMLLPAEDGGVPRTSSGKVARSAAKARYEAR
ncbi:fatty acyl-AMP ligase [Amycolatopsis sp. YIM 10]|uniref:fatty acyl-AMP ligase n=1 Tax=Amycolatopsis sp. YIM 10 TaxID=2653857 RepID=UPI003519E2A9